MQKGIKPFLIASLLAAFLAGTVALAAKPPDETKCDPAIIALFGEGMCGGDSVAGMKCDPHDYPKKDNSTCSRCQQVVTDWKKKLKDLASKTAGKDKDLEGGLTNATSELGTKTDGSPLEAMKGAGKTKKAGSKTQKDRAENARNAETELKNCQAEVQKACRQLVKDDRAAPEQINGICAEAAKKAGDFAKNKDKNGGDMKKAADGLGDAMKALGPALAQLAQAMAKKDEPEQPNQQDPPQQYPQDTAQTTPEAEEKETAVSELDKKDSKTGDSGAINGVQFGTLARPEVVATGSGLTGMPIGGASSSKRDSDSGSSPLGPGGAGEAPNTGSAGGGGGGPGGGGGGGSGSSQKGDGAVAADVAKDLGLELNYAGGVRAGGGGKGSKGADDPPPMLDAGLPPPGDLPPMEAERDPAGAEEDLNDAGDSIFMRVKSRYATLKGAGRI